METPDGRGFRYAKVGATSTVAGKVYQGTALDATNLQPSGGLAVAAAAIGATSVTLTGSLTLAANLVAGGYMTVVVTPGIGHTYKIKGNSAVAGAANCVVYLEDPIRVALTTDSKVALARNPYDSIVLEPGTPTASIVGVAPSVIVNGEYGWIQTRGPIGTFFTGTGVAGKAVGSLSGGTAGSSAPAIAATNILGYQMYTGITVEYPLTDLAIG
jgi:hypothetical protein